MKIAASLALAFGLTAVTATASRAGTCETLLFEDLPFVVCTAHVGEDLRLFLRNADGRPLGSFAAVNDVLASDGATLAFAMNAGMYHADRRPVGYYVEGGQELAPLQRKPGPGNFGLVPNGVFCITEQSFAVIETLAFDAARPDCRYATQSGPMLVLSGQLHPKFLADSSSLNLRNGVGTSEDGQTAYFAISGQPVNFHTFARLFRDGLGATNALFLDGSISRLFAPELGRNDFGLPMGPIVGLVIPAPAATAD